MSPGVDIVGAGGLAPFPGEGLPVTAAERAAAVAPTALVVAVRAVIERLRRLHRDVEAAAPLPPARLAAAVARHTELVEAALQLVAVIEVDGRAPTAELQAGVDRALESARTLGFDRV